MFQPQKSTVEAWGLLLDSLNLSVVDEASDFVDIESDYSSRHNASKVPSIDSSAPQAKADSPEKVAVFGIANASSSVL
jgi:hypothetical protein